MINIAKPLALTLLAGMISSASAQELKKEVEIRYQEAPELRDMTKLAVDPTISLPAQKQTSLPYSTAPVDVALPSSIAMLEPAPYADTIYTSPYRGYAALGFMPRFNLGASAGYTFLNTDHTRLNGWLQYDGTAYRGRSILQLDPDPNGLNSRIVRRNTATVGVNLHQAVGKESFIDFGTDYTFTRFNNRIADRWANQNINHINISGLWTMTHGKLSYGLGAAFARFAPTNAWGYVCSGTTTDSGEYADSHSAVATRESRYDIAGFLHSALSRKSSAGLNFQFTHQGYNHDSGLTLWGGTMLGHGDDRLSQSTLRIAPFYRFATGHFDLDLGVNLDLTFNQGKTFHVAPQARVDWTPGDFLKIYLKASGGQHINSLSSLYQRNPYAVPFGSWRNSQVALEAEVGATFGQWKGFFAEASFTFARANDWLMPVAVSDLIEFQSTFNAIDLSGVKLHAALGYNYRNIASIKASIDLAPQKIDRGYYLWTDRAKRVVGVDLTVRPMNRLDINLGWEYRGSRATGTLQHFGYPSDSPEGIFSYTLTDLKSINNLKVGALYRITDRWSVFLTGENLLGRSYYLVSGIEAQGRTGLLGATYKF